MTVKLKDIIEKIQDLTDYEINIKYDPLIEIVRPGVINDTVLFRVGKKSKKIKYINADLQINEFKWLYKLWVEDTLIDMDEGGINNGGN